MPLADEIRRSIDLEVWMSQQFHGLETQDERVTLTVALHDLTQEFHRATAVLFQQGFDGTAAALLRPTFETLVRATWLFHGATEDQFQGYLRDSVPGIQEMMRAIEGIPHGAWFRRLYDYAWKAMCGYTHGGIHQASRRFDGAEIAPNYPEDEKIEVMRMAGFLAILSVMEIGVMFERRDLVEEATRRAAAWFPQLTPEDDLEAP